MTYDLISFDMDGTLLSSAQTITPATLAAIRRAACSMVFTKTKSSMLRAWSPKQF